MVDMVISGKIWSSTADDLFACLKLCDMPFRSSILSVICKHKPTFFSRITSKDIGSLVHTCAVSERAGVLLEIMRCCPNADVVQGHLGMLPIPAQHALLPCLREHMALRREAAAKSRPTLLGDVDAKMTEPAVADQKVKASAETATAAATAPSEQSASIEQLKAEIAGLVAENAALKVSLLVSEDARRQLERANELDREFARRDLELAIAERDALMKRIESAMNALKSD